MSGFIDLKPHPTPLFENFNFLNLHDNKITENRAQTPPANTKLN